MNFELSDERRMLRDALERFLRDTCTPTARAAAEQTETGFSPEIWAGLAEMGVIGAVFDENVGGFAGSGFDLAVVFEALGRAGAVEPLLEVVLTGSLIAERGDADQRALLETVIAGEMHLALAHYEPAGRYDLERVATTATATESGYRIDGRKAVVVNAGAADTIVVSARTSGDVADKQGISLFLVPRDTPGLTLRDYALAGGGRAAELKLEAVELPAAARLGCEGDAFDALERAVARASVAQCAEALGLMEAIRELTTDYLRTRKQFGQPIGKFQALQHRMADLLIEIEQARSAVINVAGHLDRERDLRERHVSAAKQLIGTVAKLVAEESIQMHGGIGMTQEYELAHLVRRLTMIDHRFGDHLHHLARFVRLKAA